MGRAIVRPAVCLDLDDPRDPLTRVVVTDQPRPEQLAGDVRGRSGEAPSVDDAQAAPPGYIDRILVGMNKPTSVKNAGMIVSRKIPTIWD